MWTTAQAFKTTQGSSDLKIANKYVWETVFVITGSEDWFTEAVVWMAEIPRWGLGWFS